MLTTFAFENGFIDFNSFSLNLRQSIPSLPTAD
jgi:hypothetical protein